MAALMRAAEIICPDAVAMIRRRATLGTLWRAEDERAESERLAPKPAV